MRNRWLAVFICISMIFGGMPVSAAEAKDANFIGEGVNDAAITASEEVGASDESETLPAADTDTDGSFEDSAIMDDSGEDSGDDQSNAVSDNDGGSSEDNGSVSENDDSSEDNGDSEDDQSGKDGSDDNDDGNDAPAEEGAVSDAEQPEAADVPETVSDNSTEWQINEITATEAVVSNRKIDSVNVTATYSTATFAATVSWTGTPDWTDISLCYRQKGVAEEWKSFQTATNKAVYQFETRLNRLTPDTEYEYVLILSDSYIEDPAETTEGDVKQEGTFRTKKCEYALEFATKENAVSSRQAVVSVTAKNVTDLEIVKLTLTLSDGQKRQTTLRKAQGFQKDVTFTELAGGTKYTVTDAVFTVREDIEELKMQAPKQEETPYFEFTTAKGEAPVSITLSEEKIGLNVLYSGDSKSYEGFNTKKLTVVTEPAVSAAELTWESSNPNVAAVTEAGEVRVKGASAAPVTITVSSIYDPAVKATCEVTARRYVIGSKETDGSIHAMEQYGEKITLYKGESVSRYLLCEMNAAGKCTVLSGEYNVTFSNPAVASWSEGKLTGISVGMTDVIVEKDGVRSLITLQVSAAGKNFAITNIESIYNENRAYAIKEGNGSYLLAYSAENAEINSYRASVRIMPGEYYNQQDFDWTTSDPAVAIADATGKVTVKGAGTTDLTIKPKKYHTIDGAPYEQESAKVTLTVKALLPQESAELYALVNTKAKLKDVTFPEGWGEGWAWKYPNTPLVTNGVEPKQYAFEAVYGGDEYFQAERTVTVKIGKITAVNVFEPLGRRPMYHVLEVSDSPETADWLRLEVTPEYQGYEPPADGEDYVVEMPAVKNLEVKEVAFGVYDVRALKKGNYTLRPVIKAPGTNGKVLAKTTYPIKAVEEKQAASMRIKDGNRYLGTDQTGDFFENLDVTENRTDFTLQAEITGRNGKAVNTPLTWKSADSKVAVVAPISRTDTHEVKVTIKGSGHVVITAQAKDAAGVKAKINLEIRDHTPRIDKNKLTVNMAYDYSNAVGKLYAVEAGGTVEIVPVYGEEIRKVELRQKGSEAAAEHLTIEHYEREQYLILPQTGLSTGTYDCEVSVETDGQTAEGKAASYTYPLKVTVTDKAPKLKVQMGAVPNLFYNNMGGTILIKTPGYLSSIETDTVTWKDDSPGSNNGFRLADSRVDYDEKAKAYVVEIEQEAGLTVVNKKADAAVTKGTLSFKLKGYQKPYTFTNVTLKYKYQKPTLVTKNANSNVILSAGRNKGRLTVYSKTDKRDLRYSTAAADNSPFSYEEITADRADVMLEPNDSYWYDGFVDYTYTGGETKQKVEVRLTLASRFWREDLTAVHTIRTIKPVAYLKYKQLTFNSAARGAIFNEVYMKDMDNEKNNITYADMEIKGANPKSQKLLDDDRLIIMQGGSNYVSYKNGNAIKVEQSQDLGNPIAPGTYSYKITPYYKKSGTNERTALNTLTLTIKVINKPVTANVSPKGTIDLTRVEYLSERKDQVVLVDPKFGNLSNGYEITDYKLQGEYSRYFELKYGEIKYGGKEAEHYYIQPKERINQRLRAGQTYKLSIVYTLGLNYGYGFRNSVTVTSNTFAIRPKQSAPAIKVKNNNQTLYAGAAGYQRKRKYYLSMPDGYRIEDISGSIDCNKDGRADIEVSGPYYDSDCQSDYAVVWITDRYAALTAANGKTYTVPVTVKYSGRDGISQDAKISIKVKIKR